MFIFAHKYLFKTDAKIVQIWKLTKNIFQNMDTIKERLIQFAKSQGLMMMDFYKKISVAHSNFSGEGANSALSTDKIVHIQGVQCDQFSYSVESDFLRPHGLQHARLPSLSPTPGACSNSRPSSQ